MPGRFSIFAGPSDLPTQTPDDALHAESPAEITSHNTPSLRMSAQSSPKQVKSPPIAVFDMQAGPSRAYTVVSRMLDSVLANDSLTRNRQDSVSSISRFPASHAPTPSTSGHTDRTSPRYDFNPESVFPKSHRHSANVAPSPSFIKASRVGTSNTPRLAGVHCRSRSATLEWPIVSAISRERTLLADREIHGEARAGYDEREHVRRASQHHWEEDQRVCAPTEEKQVSLNHEPQQQISKELATADSWRQRLIAIMHSRQQSNAQIPFLSRFRGKMFGRHTNSATVVPRSPSSRSFNARYEGDTKASFQNALPSDFAQFKCSSQVDLVNASNGTISSVTWDDKQDCVVDYLNSPLHAFTLTFVENELEDLWQCYRRCNYEANIRCALWLGLMLWGLSSMIVLMYHYSIGLLYGNTFFSILCIRTVSLAASLLLVMSIIQSGSFPFTSLVIDIIKNGCYRIDAIRNYDRVSWCVLLSVGAVEIAVAGIENEIYRTMTVLILAFLAMLSAGTFRHSPASTALLNVMLIGSFFIMGLLRNSLNIGLGFGIICLSLFINGLIFTFFAARQELRVRREFLEFCKLTQEESLNQQLLQKMLPLSIITKLRNGAEYVFEKHDSVSVLFSHIHDFDLHTASMQPLQLVKTLNRMFSVFDALTDEHRVYKVETIGDVFLVCSNCPVEYSREDHAFALCLLSLDMMEVADAFVVTHDETRRSSIMHMKLAPILANSSDSTAETTLPSYQTRSHRREGMLEVPKSEPLFPGSIRRSKLHLRIGINTGPVIAGVVGRKHPRYRLMGDTINTASRMSTTCRIGQIQLTSSTMSQINQADFIYQTCVVDVKGKGLMDTFILQGHRLEHHISAALVQQASELGMPAAIPKLSRTTGLRLQPTTSFALSSVHPASPGVPTANAEQHKTENSVVASKSGRAYVIIAPSRADSRATESREMEESSSKSEDDEALEATIRAKAAQVAHLMPSTHRISVSAVGPPSMSITAQSQALSPAEPATRANSHRVSREGSIGYIVPDTICTAQGDGVLTVPTNLPEARFHVYPNLCEWEGKSPSSSVKHFVQSPKKNTSSPTANSEKSICASPSSKKIPHLDLTAPSQTENAVNDEMHLPFAAVDSEISQAKEHVEDQPSTPIHIPSSTNRDSVPNSSLASSHSTSPEPCSEKNPEQPIYGTALTVNKLAAKFARDSIFQSGQDSLSFAPRKLDMPGTEICRPQTHISTDRVTKSHMCKPLVSPLLHPTLSIQSTCIIRQVDQMKAGNGSEHPMATSKIISNDSHMTYVEEGYELSRSRSAKQINPQQKLKTKDVVITAHSKRVRASKVFTYANLESIMDSPRPWLCSFSQTFLGYADLESKFQTQQQAGLRRLFATKSVWIMRTVLMLFFMAIDFIQVPSPSSYRAGWIWSSWAALIVANCCLVLTLKVPWLLPYAAILHISYAGIACAVFIVNDYLLNLCRSTYGVGTTLFLMFISVVWADTPLLYACVFVSFILLVWMVCSLAFTGTISVLIIIQISAALLCSVTAYFNEHRERVSFLRFLKHENEKATTRQLLANLLPKQVIDSLTAQNMTFIAHDRLAADVLFLDVVQFTRLAARSEPEDVVAILNVLFSAFDAVTDKYGTYKVETIGDAYLACSGVVEERSDHALHIVESGLAMRRVTRLFRTPDHEPIVVRIGIHTGFVIAGVVGRKMPRYHLFGETVSIAEEMERNAPPGQVTISETTYNSLSTKDLKLFDFAPLDPLHIGTTFNSSVTTPPERQRELKRYMVRSAHSAMLQRQRASRKKHLRNFTLTSALAIEALHSKLHEIHKRTQSNATDMCDSSVSTTSEIEA